jgi:predicted transcriptional regulator
MLKKNKVGRPAKPNTSLVTVRMPDEHIEKLQKIAAKNDRAVSWTAAKMIAEALEAESKM